jgi:hypothetical protein
MWSDRVDDCGCEEYGSNLLIPLDERVLKLSEGHGEQIVYFVFPTIPKLASSEQVWHAIYMGCMDA